MRASAATSTAGDSGMAGANMLLEPRRHIQCTCSTTTHQGKPKAAAQQGDNLPVWLLTLLSQERGDPREKSIGMLAIATRGREHNGHEGGMLNFPYSLLVLPALFLFMASVASSEGGGTIRRRKRVEHPYINKDALESATPHTTSRNVQPSLLLRDSCAMAEGLSAIR